MKSGMLAKLMLLLALVALAACESEEATSIRLATDPDGPGLEVSFYRKYSPKSGRRSGKADTFTIGEKAYVRAFADFSNLLPERDYTAHLVWIRPDGRELFRRFAEFRLTGEAGAYAGTIYWKDATDLHKIRTTDVTSDDLSVSLNSSFNISTERHREPGTYRFRVYLDRRLLREQSFTVELPAT